MFTKSPVGKQSTMMSMPVYIQYSYKNKTGISVSYSCKSHRSKTANVKIFYSQILSTEASFLIYTSHWPVINAKASFWRKATSYCHSFAIRSCFRDLNFSGIHFLGDGFFFSASVEKLWHSSLRNHRNITTGLHVTLMRHLRASVKINHFCHYAIDRCVTFMVQPCYVWSYDWHNVARSQ